jgi:glycosyltransferase involved in cell wall biosynthesis
MTQVSREDAGSFGVAFVGTYGPRRCGIAAFTADLARSIAGDNQRVTPMVIAVTEPWGQYQYPPEVKFEIRQNTKADYLRAAEFVNYSDIRFVSIQHEYGIFGGDDGSYILEFASALRVPVIVTLHTVLKQPSDNQRLIVQKLAGLSAQLVVMSQVALQLLDSSYGVRGAKVRILPHGIPVMDGRPDPSLKSKFGIAGRRMLLTFGLLSPNKGIETVIRALPKVVREYPDLIYFVVGATHPVILRREGEAYRTMLEREAERLGVREHLMFRGQFVTDLELRQYLTAADVFVSPYRNEAQVTSGALSYAMGAGAAVVSTPYWHAQELLAGGRGRLFPFQDHEALARVLGELLSAPAELERVRQIAREFAAEMAWPRIGNGYYELLRRAPPHALQAQAGARSAVRASTLPELRLDHMVRLTDDTGIIQHATYSVPARSSGYCVDDNARALIVAVLADRIHGTAETRTLVTRYLSYMHVSQNADGTFNNFMSYARELDTQPASDDCIGRALWGLGTTLWLAEDEGCRLLAREMFMRALPHALPIGPRGTAQAMLGLVQLLAADPGNVEARELLQTMAAKLLRCYRENASPDWRWFEPSLTYDNAILPLALFAAYGVTGDRACLRDAREALEFLEEQCCVEDKLHLVGNAGWHCRGGEKAGCDEQAIDAAAFVLAFHRAYRVTNDRHYAERTRQAFAWFLGSNRLGLPLYDFETGGCRDGMGMSQLNLNQGAESTLCFLLALLEMLDLASETRHDAHAHDAHDAHDASHRSLTV